MQKNNPEEPKASKPSKASKPKKPKPPIVKSRGSELLRLFRKWKGMSQRDFAAYLATGATGISNLEPGMIGRWETGKESPSEQDRWKISERSRGLVLQGSWNLPPENPARLQMDLFQEMHRIGLQTSAEGRG